MRNIIACLLVVVCLVMAGLATIHQAQAKSTNPQITVDIKPSNHKIAYFSPTYVYCTVTLPQQCNIKFVNKINKPVTLYAWTHLLATIKPGASTVYSVAYNPVVDGPDEHPTAEVGMSSASCWIFVTQASQSPLTPTPTPLN